MRKSKIKFLSFLITLILFISPIVVAGEWASGNVLGINFKGQYACVHLSNAGMVKLDLVNEGGKAKLSAAFLAFTAGKLIKVYQDIEPNNLEGGCNTGNTVKPHSMFKIIQ